MIDEYEAIHRQVEADGGSDIQREELAVACDMHSRVSVKDQQRQTLSENGSDTK